MRHLPSRQCRPRQRTAARRLPAAEAHCDGGCTIVWFVCKSSAWLGITRPIHTMSSTSLCTRQCSSVCMRLLQRWLLAQHVVRCPAKNDAKTGGVLHVTCSAPPGLHSELLLRLPFLYLTVSILLCLLCQLCQLGSVVITYNNKFLS